MQVVPMTFVGIETNSLKTMHEQIESYQGAMKSRMLDDPWRY